MQQLLRSLKINAEQEKDLMMKVAEGDEKAFSLLFNIYHQHLGSHVFRITKSNELTQEIVQDVFIKIWQKRHLLTEVVDFKRYIHTTSRNHTYNCLRQISKAHIQQAKWVQENKDICQQEDVDFEDKFHRLIDKAIGKLPPQQQKVYLLSRDEKLKHKEIANQLNLSSETVKKYIKLALRFINTYVLAHKEHLSLLIFSVTILHV